MLFNFGIVHIVSNHPVDWIQNVTLTLKFTIVFNKNKEVFSLNCSYLYSSIFLGTLHNHLQRHGIDYLQFSFRWMNNLLTREIPLRCSIRLWDTYLAESDSFASFQLYVCAAFLLHWRQDLLLERDFQVSLFSYSHSN